MYFKRQQVKTRWSLWMGIVALFALPLTTHGQSNASSNPAFQADAAREAKIGSALLANTVFTIRVDCGNPHARVKTIASGLNLLGNLRPAVLSIAGSCHENVTISSLDRITLQGNPTATIDGGNDPNFDAVNITDSQNIWLTNLTITGGGSGVVCGGQSLCRLNQVTVQNSLGVGVVVNVRAHLSILDSVIQNNGDVGLYIGGSVNYFGGTVIGNASNGISLRPGAYFQAAGGSLTPTVSIQDNAGNGIAAGHGTVVLNPANITGNAGDGLSLQAGSAATILDSSIANNVGHQVRIGDLSFARFGSNTVTGANSPDVVCDPLFSTTRGLGNLTGSTTNCPAELPPTP